ncbi:MAG: NTP transferase domain-containing protein [Ignavibacteria bacterium]|jgi:NDP-sugar pyrophosphorylase family protein|nr:NTP transferase domain-containing protein [Ignavibacteria bacterium]MCU7502919.1 NTP transferase domain-containing protein [Ignavibacteria bacterium]MCU7515587.1 NTP transferase domain-containing protein [Ignavibacteria bacterium]
MNLAIIGAGESSRLRSEGLQVPKHLISLNGEYLIERTLRIARENGIDRACCIINEKEHLLRQYLTEADFGIPLQLIVKSTPSSMHSLFELSPLLKGEPFCMATVDSVFDESEFSDYISYAKIQNDTDGVLAITNFIDDEKPLCVALDDNDRILKFSDNKEGYSWATGGLYYFTPEIFNEVQRALKYRIERLRNFLRLLVSEGYVLKGFSFSKMIDIDHISDIKQAELFLSEIKDKHSGRII